MIFNGNYFSRERQSGRGVGTGTFPASDCQCVYSNQVVTLFGRSRRESSSERFNLSNLLPTELMLDSVSVYASQAGARLIGLITVGED